MTSDDTPTEHDVSTAGSDRRIRSEWDGSERPSIALVKAVAALTGRDPMTMPPLYESIDPDALNALVTARETEQTATVDLSFVYDGVAVRIDSDGALDVQFADANRG